MAQRTVSVGAIKNKDGEDFDPTARSAGNGASFRLVEPGYYLAVVRKVTENTDDWRKFSVNGKPIKNKKNKDGKWNYWSITPDIQLMNENGTIINRQNFQIGVLDEGALVRPDQDPDKSPLWDEGKFMLSALGALRKTEEGKFDINFDPDVIENQIIKVKVETAAYIKGQPGYNPKDLVALLTNQNDGTPYDFGDIADLVDQYNADNGLSEGDNKLKTKNFVTQVFGVDSRTVTEKGFYLDDNTGAVFLSEADYQKHLQLKDLSDNHQDPDL